MSAEPLASGVLSPLTGTYRFVKRALDIVIAVLALGLAMPLMLCITLAIVLDSRGAPLFRQRRVGRFGDEFMMWKFRTMVSGAELRRSELLAHSRDRDWLHLDHDPRITRFGQVLRRTSLDELPQLLHVLVGQMSLVGPRPLPSVEHAHLPNWSLSRLDVRPGLTGLWQVTGRARLGFQEMLRLDCEYVRELSWRSDLKILALTLPAVATGRGAN